MGEGFLGQLDVVCSRLLDPRLAAEPLDWTERNAGSLDKLIRLR
jgi:hypothetical protein